MCLTEPIVVCRLITSRILVQPGQMGRPADGPVSELPQLSMTVFYVDLESEKWCLVTQHVPGIMTTCTFY